MTLHAQMGRVPGASSFRFASSVIPVILSGSLAAGRQPLEPPSLTGYIEQLSRIKRRLELITVAIPADAKNENLFLVFCGGTAPKAMQRRDA
jgi:hypothetical protein